jgi:hypothetical protein
LAKFSADPPVYVWAWFLNCDSGSDFQTDELLESICSLRKKQVTAASVFKNWMQHGIQPLQKREHFGFQYEGTQDESRLSAEAVDSSSTLRVVWSIFPDQLSVPYVPRVFRASNPHPEVRWPMHILFFGVFKWSTLKESFTFLV